MSTSTGDDAQEKLGLTNFLVAGWVHSDDSVRTWNIPVVGLLALQEGGGPGAARQISGSHCEESLSLRCDVCGYSLDAGAEGYRGGEVEACAQRVVPPPAPPAAAPIAPVDVAVPPTPPPPPAVVAPPPAPAADGGAMAALLRRMDEMEGAMRDQRAESAAAQRTSNARLAAAEKVSAGLRARVESASAFASSVSTALSRRARALRDRAVGHLVTARASLAAADAPSLDAYEVVERIGRRTHPIAGSRRVRVAAAVAGQLFCSLTCACDTMRCGRYYGVNAAVFHARHIASGTAVALKLMCVPLAPWRACIKMHPLR
jgi:hypothetical protein